MSKFLEETSATVDKLPSEYDSEAASYHELLTSFRRILKAHEERKDKAANTLVKLRKVCDD